MDINTRSQATNLNPGEKMEREVMNILNSSCGSMKLFYDADRQISGGTFALPTTKHAHQNDRQSSLVNSKESTFTKT